MKKVIRTVALLSVIALMPTSCEKETFVCDKKTTSQMASMQKVTYTVDGMTTQVMVLSDEAWYDFLDWMFALAEEGHRVSFRRGAASERSASKETVTFTTQDQNEAYDWANMMAHHGYTVQVSFDRTTGIYTCTAIR